MVDGEQVHTAITIPIRRLVNYVHALARKQMGARTLKFKPFRPCSSRHVVQGLKDHPGSAPAAVDLNQILVRRPPAFVWSDESEARRKSHSEFLG